MKVYKDDYQSLDEFEFALEEAKENVLHYKNSEGVPFPRLGSLTKHIAKESLNKIKYLNGDELQSHLDSIFSISEYEYTPKTKEEEKTEISDAAEKEKKEEEEAEEAEREAAKYSPSEKYKEYRLKDYPSIEDQLDKIYHHGVEGWKSLIFSIKDRYPKP